MIEACSVDTVRAAEQPLLDAGLGDLLMRRAARGLARECERQLRLTTPDGALRGTTAVLLVGSGNNGGDGLWAGSFLRARGVAVTAVLTGSRVHEDGLAALRAAGGSVLRLSDHDDAAHRRNADLPDSVAAAGPVGVDQAVSLMASAHLVVDAVLGTGASGGLRGAVAELVAAFHDRAPEQGRGTGQRTPRVVACDLVSGVSGDTGEAPEPLLRAHATVTFGAAKTGHVVSPGEQVTGELTVVPIGIEDRLGDAAVHRLEAQDVLAAWPRPGATDTKYSRGVLGVVAGAPSYPGAAIMCTQAAVNAGAGMVRFLGDSTARAMVLARSPEVVCSDDQPWDVHVQAWLAGPGVVGDESQAARVQAVIEAKEPAVLDAGALDAAARSVADARLGPHKVLTPHAGELSQIFEWLHGFGLCDAAVERSDIEAAPLHWAREAARLTGATVLLKGATTVIASPVGDAASSSGAGECLCLSVGDASPWLATAGSGDTLAGILGTVLAHVAEHPQALAGLGDWARGAGRWAAAAALGAGLHALASRVRGESPVPPSVLAENVRAVLTRP
ncbi:bifunctional ADP-dependent NAD(P)H-hydrate dehydratase/NAD(P)H-hydrate epimerase [Kocuria tytonis]|uniref:Bifunctional NAD(P)H-hydrate repair enzyme n=1 Tax=Kocuria tytonis TaxID=2054280 RepID=A0A495AA34_9MICC|nr:bifunctional ADP-dependent NAD(P)H-hydrate dehydratase/NAD(P)H-hydrate epimerase [Kocuria tytonis]RKQ36899.1 bifunctional ADP-dependent NAD(P)H-hydrate dehydratase/NAD(P)H-hydrate epimerase [Kocuria tytonis]